MCLNENFEHYGADNFNCATILYDGSFTKSIDHSFKYMKRYPAYILAFALQLFASALCRAQPAPAALNLKQPPANINIDGDIKEWGDSLSHYSPEERITYDIANSKDTLYVAVKIYDRTEIARIMLAGLTFSIDPRGKKKETYSMTYPLNVGGAPAFNVHTDNEDNITQADRDELQRERLTTLRGIKVVGFKDIEDDMITTSNTYGFQAAIDYDAVGNLVYEAAIPIKFFHADGDLKNGWAFNIKINGKPRPTPGSDDSGDTGGGGGGRGGGMGGGGGGRHGGGGKRGGGSNKIAENSELFQSIDFWGKFYLSK